MAESRANPTGVYGLLRRSWAPLDVIEVADSVGTGVKRAHVILKALVAAGLVTADRRVVPVKYAPIEVESLSARRKQLKFARELWQDSKPAGNNEARTEIMRFKSGRYR